MSMATLVTDVPIEAKKARLEATREMRLLVKKLSAHATVPTRGSSQAAGYDLYR